jgi:hypothetical protein
LDKNKINEVVNKFFNSLKSPEDKQLETGLSQHTTLEMLKQACLMAINDNPEKFEIYTKWFLNGSMYLLDEDSELLDIEEQLRLAR